jgi:tetratricopeptide (TPR) repeat protein
LKLGDYERAEKSYRQAIALNPGFALAYSQLAGILALKEKTAESALDFAMKVVEMEPGVLNHRLVLANTLMHLKKVDSAIQYAEQVETAAASTRDREEATRFLSVARRYQSNLEAQKQSEGTVGQLQQSDGIEENRADSQMDQDFERIKQREEEEKAIEDAEREEQRLLNARSDAYEKRERIETAYLAVVRKSEADGTASLKGIIREVECFDPAGIELMLDADGYTHRMHVANYFQIRFLAMDHTPEGELKPCTDLLGRTVTVDYIATPEEDYAGEIQSIGIYKNPQPDTILPASD